MIYFMEFQKSKPKRIHTDHALDFYQMWFGNNTGQELFEYGSAKTMPGDYRFVLYGKEITEPAWFKMILQGKAEDGYVDLSGDPRAAMESWNS